VRDVLAGAGLPIDALVVCCVPDDASEVKENLRPFMEGVDELPGVLARGEMADAAMELANSLGLKAPDDVSIVSADYYFFHRDHRLRYPVLRPTWTFEQMGAELGRIVSELAHGRLPGPIARRIPVKLELPPEDQ
jgi:DNA-binding LacI/PurR family transcriptional regulator